MDSYEEPHSTMIDGEQFSYEEVEGVISNKDDPEMLSLTIRSCLTGFLLAIGRSMFDAYFSFKARSYYIDLIFTIPLSYILGKILAWILPRYQCRINKKFQFSLNPGPFTIKEHVLITFMIVSCQSQKCIQQIVMRRIYFPQHKIMQPISTIGYLISIQLVGFGLAGIFRRFLIWPSKMIWPNCLPIVVQFRILHDKNVDGPVKDSLGRFGFFSIISIGQLIYGWLSSFIMPVLQNFSPLCLINTQNRLLAALTGVNGFGIGALRLNWLSITSYLSSPIVVPRWAQVNLCIGFILTVWISGPLVYYTNLWDSKNLPIRSTDYLTINNTHYNLTAISNDHYQFNRTAYDLYNKNVGGVRVSAMHIIQLCTSFAILPAIFVHTILYHGKWILKQIRTSFANHNNDIHCKLMSQYPETPEWWFILLFVLNLLILMIVSHLNNILPWDNVLIAAIVSSICVLPFGIIEAETAQGKLSGTIFAYFLLGAYLLPSDPSSYIAFPLQIGAIQGQALIFLQFLKISHFMKIPPRAVFGTTLISIILSSIATYFITEYALNSIPDPSLLFGKDEGLYYPTLWFMLIGAILPFLFWILSCWCPDNKYLKRIHIPLILAIGTYWYAESAASILTWLLLGGICAFLVYRWWYTRYAIVFSAAMSFGAKLTSLFIAFILDGHEIKFPEWWGTKSMCPLDNPTEKIPIYL